MRKILLTLFCSATSVLTWAQYPYLAFRTLDGGEQTISTIGLEITLSDDTLIATAADECICIPLVNLANMQFADCSAKTENIGADYDSEISVFRTDGTLAGTYPTTQDATHALDAGIYLFKDNKGETYKVVVKR